MFDRKNGITVRTEFQTPDVNLKVYNRALMQNGAVPSARVAFSVNPANNDTLTVGGSSFTFKTSLAAATTTTQVKIGSSAAVTLASLLNAINGVADPTVVKNTTPFAASVLADAVTATVLRLRLADRQGGSPIAGASGSLTLAASVTGGASAWSVANLNASGKDPSGGFNSSLSKFTVTAAMVANGGFPLELNFTPTAFMFQVLTAGVIKSSNEAVAISGNSISFTMAGGASPNLAAGDVVTVLAVA